VTGSGVGRQGRAAVWRPGSRWKFVPVAAAMAAVAVLYEAWILFRFGGARLTVAVDDVGLAGVVAVAAVLTALRARRSVDPGALLLVSWLTVMRAVYTAGGTDPFTFALGLAYPIGDVVTMVIVLSALSQTRRLDSSLAVVFAGISVITVTDSIYGYLTATNVYEGAN